MKEMTTGPAQVVENSAVVDKCHPGLWPCPEATIISTGPAGTQLMRTQMGDQYTRYSVEDQVGLGAGLVSEMDTRGTSVSISQIARH